MLSKRISGKTELAGCKSLQILWAVCVFLCLNSRINGFTEQISDANAIIRGYSGQVAPVMDLDDDLFCYFHNRDLLEQKIRLLADCGFKRFYVIAPPPGEPDYSTRVLPKDGPPSFLRQSRAAIGNDPLKQAIAMAKKAGMKVFVQFKPYEGGGAFTVPEGFVPPCGRNWLETLGGRAIGLDPFIIEHPDMLEARKPTEDVSKIAADRIEIAFVLDYIAGWESLQVAQGTMKKVRTAGYPALGASVITDYPAKNFAVYTSEDNGRYDRYRGEFSVSERIERRLIRNANGELIFPGAVLCRVIELSGLKLESPYFALNFEGEGKAFRTIPYSNSCFKVFLGKKELPVTISPKIRGGQLTGKEGFEQNGFEFEENGPYYWDYGWRTLNLYGFAKGKAKHVRGSLCEAYAEVREHWLDQIKHYIEIGCDGVDIRLQDHCSGITDFVNYGFNQPLVNAYKDRYGVDITRQDPDPIKLMQLRGEFFLMFVKDAAEMLHKKGLKLQTHVDDYLEHPTLDPTFTGAGFWCAPKMLPDWQKLIEIADEITVKDYNWGIYSPYMSGRMKTAAYQAGKPLWIHCYMQQGHDMNPDFIKAVLADKRVTGLLLYEVVYSDGIISDGMVDITDDGMVRLVPGSPITKMLVHCPEARHAATK